MKKEQSKSVRVVYFDTVINWSVKKKNKACILLIFCCQPNPSRHRFSVSGISPCDRLRVLHSKINKINFTSI